MSDTTPSIEAVLDISPAAYAEIAERFRAAGANLEAEMDGQPVIVLGTFAFRREVSDAQIRAYLVYQGKVLPKGENNGKQLASRDIIGSIHDETIVYDSDSNEAAGEVQGPPAQDVQPPAQGRD